MALLKVAVVYDSPTDYPGQVVGRFFEVLGPKIVPDALPFEVADTVDEVRARIPDGMTCLGRRPEDEAHIVEVWI